MENNRPVVKIKGARQTKAVRNVKPKYSNFHLTINTNQQYKEGDANLANDEGVLDDLIQNILNHIDAYVKLPEGTPWDDRTIEDVDIDYVVERGAKRGQLHCHILFRFKHHTKIQLDYGKIKTAITEGLGVKNVYMYNRLVRGNGNQSVLDYINKYV